MTTKNGVESVTRVIFISDADDIISFNDWRKGFELDEDVQESIAMNFRIATFREEDNDDDVLSAENLVGMLPKGSVVTEEEYKKFIKEANEAGLLTDDFESVYRKPIVTHVAYPQK